MDPITLLSLLIIGLVAGVASGFVGIGGGLIIVPALVAFAGLGQHAAQGTSLAMMLPPVGILAVINTIAKGKFIGRMPLCFVSPSLRALGEVPSGV